MNALMQKNTHGGTPPKYVIAAAMCLIGLVSGCQPPAPQPVVSALPDPAPPGSHEPHLALTEDGQVILSWQEQEAGSAGASLRYARLGAGGWSTPVQVAAGENWFVNWADFPSVQPLDGTRMAAHWLAKRPGGTYAYDVMISLSEDGLSWSAPFAAHDDGTATEHGFVSLFPYRGLAGAVWLDGRETAGSGQGEEHAGHGGGMTLRYALFDAGGQATAAGQVDELTCDCCQTDMAPVPGGLVLAYRDRSEDEIRDVMVRRFDGTAWSTPVAVDDTPWRMPGCPVNGPAVSAKGNHVAVAWFTGAAGTGQVKLAVSHDGGASFQAPVIVDPEGAIGRTDVDWLDGTHAVVSWMAGSQADAMLRAAAVAPDGSLGTPLDIAPMSPARSSGFPQMLRAGDELVFAWTEVGESRQLKTAKIRIGDLDR